MGTAARRAVRRAAVVLPLVVALVGGALAVVPAPPAASCTDRGGRTPTRS